MLFPTIMADPVLLPGFTNILPALRAGVAEVDLGFQAHILDFKHFDPLSEPLEIVVEKGYVRLELLSLLVEFLGLPVRLLDRVEVVGVEGVGVHLSQSPIPNPILPLSLSPTSLPHQPHFQLPHSLIDPSHLNIHPLILILQPVITLQILLLHFITLHHILIHIMLQLPVLLLPVLLRLNILPITHLHVPLEHLCEFVVVLNQHPNSLPLLLHLGVYL